MSYVLASLEDDYPRSLSEKAYQLLVHRITRLQLVPGSVLVEKSLMSELEIGRTPIREALQRLANEGLVDHLPNRGMFVAPISATSVQHIYEFRGVIDCYAARLAAERASDEDIRELTRLNEALAQAIVDDDIDLYVNLDRRFYDVLARAAENIYLAEVLPRIFNLHLRLWFFISQKTGGWQPLAEAHEKMTKGVVEAIARRHPNDAERAMADYITGRHQDIRETL